MSGAIESRILGSTSGGGTNPLTTKGDLFTWDTGAQRLPVGSDGQVLTADSGQATGLKWATVSGTGTVTSVAMTVPAFLSVAGSPVTTTGTLAISLSGTALPIANGGTGATTANPAFNALSPLTTKGDVLGFSTVNARLGVGSDGQVLTADAASTLGFKWAAAAGGITALTGDVTASGSGSVAATVAAIAGVAVGTPTGTGNVVFSAGPTFTGTITAATITASGKITGSNATSFTASGSTYCYDMTATTALFGRISTAADTGTITWQSNTATNNDTHGGASIKLTANDATAANSGSLDLFAFGTGGASTNQITFNVRAGVSTTNEVMKVVNGGLLMDSGKAIQMQGSGAFTSGTGFTTMQGQTIFVNHGVYSGNSSAAIDTRAFSRNGWGLSGDLGSAATTYGFWIDPAPKSTSTTQWSELYTYANGNTGTITWTEMNAVFIDQPNLFANNTATRLNQIRIYPLTPVAGTITNGALIADNVAYTGKWNINLTSTNPSQFGGSLIAGPGSLATNATDGFLYISGGSGTPTGVPTTQTGTYAMYWDHTNKKLYVYDGSWLGGTSPGIFV